MQIEQLEYLIEIGKHKSLNSASKALHMTPQALSMAIKRLENELGFQLLYRSAVGTALTPEGRETAMNALNFLEQLEETKKRIKKQQSQRLEGEISLMMPPGSAESYMPGFQVFLYENCPKSRLIVEEANQLEIVRSVLEDENEIALIAQLMINGQDVLKDISDELEFVPLFACRACCCCSPNFPVTRFKSINLKTMLDYPLVLHEPDKYFLKPIIEMVCQLEEANIVWLSKTVMLKKFLDKGVCLGFTFANESSSQFLTDPPEGVIIPLKENIIFHEGYIIKRGQALSEKTMHLIEYLHLYFNQ